MHKLIPHHSLFISRDITPVVENRNEKRLENEMKTRFM